MGSVSARLYYPLLVAAAVIFHLALIPTGIFPEMVPSLVAGLVLLLVWGSEHRYPYQSQWLNSAEPNEVRRDFTSTMVLLPVVMLASDNFWTHLVPSLNIWPHHWPFAIQAIAAVLLADFFFYWVHRLSHEVEWLWRFHAVHHSVKRVYWLNSGTLHWVDAVLDFFCYFFPLIFLGVGRDVFLLFLTLTMVTGVLEHANVRYRAGWLNYFFNTAQLHRWHHAKNVAISQKNYGKITSIWDSVFGTFYLPSSEQGIEEVGIREESVVMATAQADLEGSRSLHAAQANTASDIQTEYAPRR